MPPPAAFATKHRATQRLANAASPSPKKAKDGRVLMPRREDFSNQFKPDLNLKTLETLFTSAINGEARELSALYDKMCYRYAHLRAESRKRFAAVRRLPWEILPATAVEEGDSAFDPKKAEEIARFCRSLARGTKGFNEMLKHFVKARGTGVMVSEIETKNGLPVAAHCVPFIALRYDDMEPWRLRIASGNDLKGLAIDEFPAGKFIVCAPELIGGNAFVGGLYFATLLWYMFATFDWRSLFVNLEIFGQPTRIGKYPPGTTQEVIDKMLAMIKDMGMTAAGVFPTGTEFDAIASGIAASQAAWPQERVWKLVNEEVTKLWIGGTLTTQMDQAGGSQASTNVHKEGFDELRDEDITDESDVIAGQFFSPFVRNAYGDDGLVYLPLFRRTVEETKDDKGDMEVLAKGINECGGQIPQRYLHDRFALPSVEGVNLDEPLPGRKVASFGDPLEPIENRSRTATREDLRIVANRALDSIRSRKGAIAKLVPFILAAVIASQAHAELVVEAIGEAIEKNESRLTDEATIGTMLAEVFAELPVDDMAELVRQAILFAELSGRAAAQSKAAGTKLVLSAEHRGAMQRGDAWLVVNAERIDFAKLPFVEAIEALRDRIGIDPDTFETLDAEARSRAFRVAAVYDMDLLAVAHTALVQSIAAGETARDFKLRTLPQMADRKGWTGENPWHADVVFYQNFAMAHVAGAHRQMVDLDIPAWRFQSNGDSCPICEPFVGKIFKLSERRNYPPLHFYCDCDADPVFEDEFSADELADLGNVNAAALAEYRKKAGAFAFDPAHYAALEPIQLDKYPTGLRPAFEALANEKGWEVETA